MQVPVWANCVNPAVLRKAPFQKARTVQELQDVIVAALLRVLGRRAALDSGMRLVLQVVVVRSAVFLAGFSSPSGGAREGDAADAAAGGDEVRFFFCRRFITVTGCCRGFFFYVRTDQEPSQSWLPKRTQFERRSEEFMEKVA